jgi:hypothetical protein
MAYSRTPYAGRMLITSKKSGRVFAAGAAALRLEANAARNRKSAPPRGCTPSVLVRTAP